MPIFDPLAHLSLENQWRAKILVIVEFTNGLHSRMKLQVVADKRNYFVRLDVIQDFTNTVERGSQRFLDKDTAHTGD